MSASPQGRVRAGAPDDRRAAPADLLAAHLLPTVLHGLGNHTQFLTGLRAVLSLSAESDVLHQRAGDLAQVSTEVEDAGWMLAVLASASGANLLLARREPRGLEIACRLVDDTLRRAAAARIGAADVAWPTLRPEALDGWQLPWGVASLLLAAGLDQPPAEFFPWSFAATDDGATLEVPLGARVEALIPLLGERLAPAATVVAAGRVRLAIPCGWLAFEGRST